MMLAPLGDKIVVKPAASEVVSSGGIIIPDTARETPQRGTVVAVGPGLLSENGERIPLQVNVGDIVIYSMYAGVEYKEGRKTYLVMREDDVYARRIEDTGDSPS